jgi:hypothetical protein
MLHDKIQSLTKRIENIKELESIAENTEAFQSRAVQLKILADDLSSHTSDIEILKNGKINFETPTPSARVQSRANKMKDSFNEDRKLFLSETHDFAQQFKAPLDGFLERIEKNSLKAWRDYIDINRPEVNTELMGILSQLQGLSKSIEKVQGIIEKIDALKDALPNDLDDFKNLSKLFKELDQAYNALRSDDIDNDTLEFLRQAGREGVPLRQLSKEVHDWLSKNNLIDQFFIKIGK